MRYLLIAALSILCACESDEERWSRIQAQHSIASVRLLSLEQDYDSTARAIIGDWEHGRISEDNMHARLRALTDSTSPLRKAARAEVDSAQRVMEAFARQR